MRKTKMLRFARLLLALLMIGTLGSSVRAQQAPERPAEGSGRYVMVLRARMAS